MIKVSFIFAFVLLFNASSAQLKVEKVLGLNTYLTGPYPGFSESTKSMSDAYGATFMAGKFVRTVDFNPNTPLDTITASNSGFEGFLSKYDGEFQYMWTHKAPGLGSYALDHAGNIYAVGIFSTVQDADPGPGVVMITPRAWDTYVMKLDNNYNLIWAKNIATNSESIIEVSDVRVDTFGNIYYCGNFKGLLQFDVATPQPNITNFNSSVRDGMVVKLDSTGSFKWCSNVRGYSGDAVNQIAIDKQQNVIGTGFTTNTFSSSRSTHFIGSGVTVSLATGTTGTNGFLVKYAPNGSVIWAKAHIGAGNSSGASVAIDKTGNIYTCGNFQASLQLDSALSSSTLTGAPLNCGYAAKFSAAGSAIWVKAMSNISGANSFAAAVATDADNNCYVSGHFTDSIRMQNASVASFQFSDYGNADIYLAKFNATGVFLNASHVGSTYSDAPNGLHVSPDQKLFLTGFVTSHASFDSAANPPINLTLEPNPNHSQFQMQHGFLARYKITAVNTGIQNTASAPKNRFKIYPNPVTSGKVHIAWEEPLRGMYKVSLYSINGQLMFSKDLLSFANNKQETRLNLPVGISTGIYSVEIIGANERWVGKIEVVQ